MLKPTSLYNLLFLLGSLFCLNSYADDNDNDTRAQHDALSVHIDETIQASTGLQTLKLQTIQFSPEIKTFALPVDISTLITARQHYFNALAKQALAQIQVNQSRLNTQYLQDLQRSNAVSTRKLRKQQNHLEIDQAQLKAAQQLSNNTRLHTQTKWGKVLSHWFLSDSNVHFKQLSTFKKQLYLTYLPQHLIPPATSILLQPFGHRELAQSASLVANAPIYNTQQTGTPFFYLSDQAFNGHHQRVTAWIPTQTETLSGVSFPASAIIWHLGQAFVYLQIDDERFKRIKITQQKPINSKTYFIQKPLQQGDRLVISGAQMLLSEEFRSQIPAEDDDDDD